MSSHSPFKQRLSFLQILLIIAVILVTITIAIGISQAQKHTRFLISFFEKVVLIAEASSLQQDLYNLQIKLNQYNETLNAQDWRIFTEQYKRMLRTFIDFNTRFGYREDLQGVFRAAEDYQELTAKILNSSVESRKNLPTKTLLTKLEQFQSSVADLQINREISSSLTSSLKVFIKLRPLIISFFCLVLALNITLFISLYQTTKRKFQRAYQRWKTTETRYNRLLNQASDAIFYIGKKGRLIDANRQACQSLGYSSKELLELSVFDISIDFKLKDFLTLNYNLKVGEYFIRNGVHKRKDSSTFPVEVKVSRLDSGDFLAISRDISTRKAVENQLRESQAQLQAIMDNAPNSIFLRDIKGHYLMINKRALASLNRWSEDIIGKTPFDFYPQDFAERIISSDERVIANQEASAPFEFVAPFDNKTYLANKFPVFDSEEKVYAVCTIATDISEHKKAETALEASQIELQALISAMPDAIFVFDKDGHYLKIISSKHNRFYSVSSVNVGQSIYKFAKKETADGIVKAIQQSLDTNNIVTHEYLLIVSGQKAWFSARISPLTSESVIFVTRSITTHKIAEIAIAESEARYRTLVENAPEAIVVFDVQTYNIVDVNENAAHFFGYKRKELLKLTLNDISAPKSNSRLNFAKFANSIQEDNAILEWLFYNFEKEEILCELRISHMPSSNKNLARCSIVDIRKRKRQEKALQMYAHYAKLTTNISSRFINLAVRELDEGVKKALAEIGKSTKVDNVGLFLFDQKNSFNCTYKWIQKEQSDFLTGEKLQGLVNYVSPSINKRILAGERVSISSALELGEYETEVEAWWKQGLKMLLILPFFSSKKTKGFLALVGIENERQWSENELAALQTLGAIFANTIERQQAEQELEEYREHLEELVEKRTDELLKVLENLKNTQQELIQSEKMAALGQLVAGVAHEVNTPLGAIHASAGNIARAFEETIEILPDLLMTLNYNEQQLFFDLVNDSLRLGEQLTSRAERKLRRQLCKDLEERNIENAVDFADKLVPMGITYFEKVIPYMPLIKGDLGQTIVQAAFNLVSQKHYSETINIATEKASKVVFALKHYAHQDHSGQKTLADIRDTLDVVLVLYNNHFKQGVEVVKDYQEVPKILCFPDELNQVWTNLVHNALQAMDYKGKIKLTVVQEGNYIVISINDNGKGIPEEVRKQIFEPFFTTKPIGEGSGLGLNIVKKIIEKHDGEINVTSESGNTTFFVKLPILQQEVVQQKVVQQELEVVQQKTVQQEALQ